MSPYIPLLVLLLAAFVGRIWTPWARAPGGLVVRRVPLSLLGRLRMQALPAVVLLALAAVGWARDGLPWWLAVVVPLVVVAVVALPFRYTLTTQGLVIGRSRIRRWTEFGGVTRRRGGVRLQGIAGSRGQRIWLSGNRDDDEFVQTLRLLLRGSYKGHVGPATTDLPAPAEITPLRPFERTPAAQS